MILRFFPVFLACAAIFYLFSQFVAATIMFRVLLVRSSRKKWTRDFCTAPKNAEHLKMWREGLKWREENLFAMKEVFIQSDGLKLAGEWFDFGFDRAAIIVAGRAETCRYSAYFAPPYKAAGFNVLLIDNRALGDSEGKFLCAGAKEWRDIALWAELLREKFGAKKIVLHGICVGAATAILAQAKAGGFSAIVAEGVYSSFAELFRRQIASRKQPSFPAVQILFALVRIFAKADARESNPQKFAPLVKIPVLLLHSKADRFAIPSEAQKVFDALAGEKKIVFFDGAPHSHIRVRFQSRYDEAIFKFLEDAR